MTINACSCLLKISFKYSQKLYRNSVKTVTKIIPKVENLDQICRDMVQNLLALNQKNESISKIFVSRPVLLMYPIHLGKKFTLHTIEVFFFHRTSVENTLEKCSNSADPFFRARRSAYRFLMHSGNLNTISIRTVKMYGL